MIIRLASTRGVYRTNWIVSRRTFSNNSYWDPRYMNWGNLKVINDDIQQPGNMVPNHEHRNYDILGYLVEGELEHTDSLGNIQRAKPGQIQHMWCGASIWHTEASVGAIPARYIQIWIMPKSQYVNSKPTYSIIDKSFSFGQIVADLHQDITIKAGILESSITTKNSYLYIVSGSCMVNDHLLNEGDGAEIESATISGDAHILLFEN